MKAPVIVWYSVDVGIVFSNASSDWILGLNWTSLLCPNCELFLWLTLRSFIFNIYLVDDNHDIISHIFIYQMTITLSRINKAFVFINTNITYLI